MKNIFKSLLVLLLAIGISNSAFAAAATVTATEYGYTITGGNSATLIPQDTWVTSTAYVVGQRVSQTGHVYTCLVAHTSGTFATDLTAGKWVKIGECTLWLNKVLFNPAGATTDTAAFTSGQSNVAAFNMNLNQEYIDFTQPQAQGATAFSNLKVTMTSASDVLYIFVNHDNFTQN